MFSGNNKNILYFITFNKRNRYKRIFYCITEIINQKKEQKKSLTKYKIECLQERSGIIQYQANLGDKKLKEIRKDIERGYIVIDNKVKYMPIPQNNIVYEMPLE